jgi:hypothetical protein
MDMKSISQKLQDDIRAIMEAGLTPKQQNIDVHEPEKDKLTADDFKKLRAMKKTPAGKVHNCATHVEHAVLGKGTTVSEEHAEPDENGNIEWYTIQFEHSTQQVLTKDLTITMSEAHVHESAEEQVDEEEKKKIVSPFDWKNRPSELAKKPGETAGFDSKKISTGTVYSRKPVKEAMSHQAKTTMKHIPNASPALKKAAKDIKPGIAGYRDRIDMLKAGGVKEEAEQIDEISTKLLAKAAHSASDPMNHYDDDAKFHDPQKFADHAKKTKDAKSAAAVQGAADAKGHYMRPGHSLGSYDKLAHRKPARVTSTGKANKQDVKTLKSNIRNEEAEQKEYTFAEYLEAARAQYVDEDAVLVANEAFKNKDITLFSDQSQSPEA